MSTLYVDNLQPNLGSQVAIPNLKPLAGSVVGAGSVTWEGELVITSSTPVLFGNVLTYNLVNPSNKLVVTGVAYGDQYSGHTNGWYLKHFNIYDNLKGYTITSGRYVGVLAQQNMIPKTEATIYQPNAPQVQLQWSCHSYGGQAYGCNASMAYINVMEIAQ